MKRLCGILLALAGLFLYAPAPPRTPGCAVRSRTHRRASRFLRRRPVPGYDHRHHHRRRRVLLARKPRHVELHPGRNGQLRAPDLSDPGRKRQPGGFPAQSHAPRNRKCRGHTGDNPAHLILAGIVRNKNTTIPKNTTATSAAPIRKWNSAWPMSGNFEAENSSKTSVSFSSTSTHRMSPDNPTCP